MPRSGRPWVWDERVTVPSRVQADCPTGENSRSRAGPVAEAPRIVLADDDERGAGNTGKERVADPWWTRVDPEAEDLNLVALLATDPLDVEARRGGPGRTRERVSETAGGTGRTELPPGDVSGGHSTLRSAVSRQGFEP